MFHPKAFASGVRVMLTNGGVASRLIVTAFVAVPPPDSAAQVNVVPVVSAVTVTGSHPFLDVIADSASVIDQVIVTSDRYHPFLPRFPEVVGTITGGVSSYTVISTVAATGGKLPSDAPNVKVSVPM